MRHQEIQKYLLLHLDGQLDDAREKLVVAHLAICLECQNLKQRLQHLYGSPALDEVVKAPPFLYTRLSARMGEQGWLAPDSAKKQLPRHAVSSPVAMALWRQVMVTAMVLMAIGMGVFLGTIPNQGEPAADPGAQLKQEFNTDILDVSAPHSYFQAVVSLYTQPLEEVR
jgi:anti-sigma factor RsiW